MCSGLDGAAHPAGQAGLPAQQRRAGGDAATSSGRAELRARPRRLRSPDDRRRHMVQLTPAGAEALSLAERAQEAIEDDVLKALDPSERATLWQLLTRALYGVEPPTDNAYSATIASIST